MTKKSKWSEALISGHLFDRWATRFGALSILQLSGLFPNDYYSWFLAFGTAILFVATVKPLCDHIIHVAGENIEFSKFFVSTALSLILIVVSFGMSTVSAKHWINALFEPVVLQGLSGSIVILGTIFALQSRIKASRNSSSTDPIASEQTSEVLRHRSQHQQDHVEEAPSLPLSTSGTE